MHKDFSFVDDCLPSCLLLLINLPQIRVSQTIATSLTTPGHLPCLKMMFTRVWYEALDLSRFRA
jgi:hypothetical protein